jgi:hypothetical protein
VRVLAATDDLRAGSAGEAFAGPAPVSLSPVAS